MNKHIDRDPEDPDQPDKLPQELDPEGNKNSPPPPVDKSAQVLAATVGGALLGNLIAPGAGGALLGGIIGAILANNSGDKGASK